MTLKFMVRFWNHCELLTFFNHPKVTTTQKQRLPKVAAPLPAKFESIGGRYFRNSTEFERIDAHVCALDQGLD